MANSSKKRKASELDSDYSSKQPKPKAKRPSKRSKGDSKAADEIPFRPECPYKPSGKTNDDVYVQREEIAPGFEFDFGVRPGQQWKNMRAYRNVKLQDHTFTIGSIIYINKQNPPPKSPRPDATDAEMLQYDRTHFWVGKIADTRAESDKAVYLRIYWLYWPEELPMGRQPYHGDREVILSNAMDIVDAQTISGAADLVYWDEKDTNQGYQDRFWRQTFDISKLGKDKKGGLSELRKHCRCQQPDNPDKIMFQCKKQSCATWNHEECLIDDVLQRAWPVYEKEGSLDTLDANNAKEEERETEHSLRNTLLSPVRQLGKMMQNRLSPALGAVMEQSTIRPTDHIANGADMSPKRGRPSKKAVRSNTPAHPPWEGKLIAQVVNIDDKDDESPVLVKVTERPSKNKKSATRSWNIRAHCLVCFQAM